jgi:hypothetical protein
MNEDIKNLEAISINENIYRLSRSG